MIKNSTLSQFSLTWRKLTTVPGNHGIIKDLHEIGLKGHLPLFVQQFLRDIQFNVRLGGQYLKAFDQEMGVTQCSILSVTLFNLKINCVVKAIPNGTDGCLYVDDLIACSKGINMNLVERQLQRCIGNLQVWADENGFKFSETKTVCVHFCQKHRLHPDPVLYLNGKQLPIVTEVKYLGVLFDCKLTFVPHVKALKTKCIKASNLLKVVSHTDWGADRAVLSHLYDAFIRSKLDYGSIVYGSARKSYLQMLDPVQNLGLRLITGAFRTSPADSLNVDTNEVPLSFRREKLALQYITKLASNKQNPTHAKTFTPNLTRLFNLKPNAISTIGIRMQAPMTIIGFNYRDIAQYSIPRTPPWLLVKPEVIFSIGRHKKSQENADLLLQDFKEIETQYYNHAHIYTDVSKDGETVAAAMVINDYVVECRIPDGCSIFTAEMKAIHLAFESHPPGI